MLYHDKEINLHEPQFRNKIIYYLIRRILLFYQVLDNFDYFVGIYSIYRLVNRRNCYTPSFFSPI